MANQWLENGQCVDADCADFDDDGDVDAADFAELAEHWSDKGHVVVLNEFMASNDNTVADPQGEYDDWIEIYNRTDVAFDIGGMWLADDNTSWQIPYDRPNETTIGPFGYLLVWADDDVGDTPGLHADFRLGADGDQILLYAVDGLMLVDGIAFADQRRDISRGRYPDASGEWVDMPDPTPARPNTAGAAGAPSFSRSAGTFTTPFALELATDSTHGEIYYTVNGNEPDKVGTLYTGLLMIDRTTWVRARVYEPNRTAGPTVSRVYIRLDNDLHGFHSNLPLAIIDTFGHDIDREWSWENRPHRPISMVFIDVNETTSSAGITDIADFAGYGGMHVRGASTAHYPKKQYKFETWDEQDRDRDVSLLGFPAESDWILHGPYSDKTLMRNHLMYAWSRSIGRYAARTRFVEVFIDDDGDGIVEWRGGRGSNTDYRGVYLLMEKVKRSAERVDIEELQPTDNDEPEITGGYLLKKDWHDQPGFRTAIYRDYIIYEDPRSDELTPDQKDWIKGYFDEFESVLSSTDFDDPIDGYVQYVDVGSWVDHHILVELAKNVDGFVLSTFLFKDRGGKINMGPIWDYNGSLGGADYFCNQDPTGWLHTFDEDDCPDQCAGEGGATFPADNPHGYRWYGRVFEDREFRLAYADRWFALREDSFRTEVLLADIDANVELLTDHGAADNPVSRNFTRWDTLNDDLWPNYLDNCNDGLTYTSYVDWLKSWLAGRLDWMDSAIASQYAAAPPSILVNGVPMDRGGHIRPDDTISIASGIGRVYYTLDGSDPRGHGGTTSPSAISYDAGGPFRLDRTSQLKARIRDRKGWSALNEATFLVGP